MTPTTQPIPDDEKHWPTSVDALCYAFNIDKGELDYLLHNLHRFYYIRPKTTKSGKERMLYTSRGLLLSLQTVIKKTLEQFPVHTSAHGWCKGRSPKTAAALHVGKPCVVSIDIADCFPSITHHHVYDLFVQLGCVADVAKVLTHLTTYDKHLPQGLRTSPVIANLVLAPVDRRISIISEKLCFSPSRYGDNINLSGNSKTEHLVKVVQTILAQSGYRTREEKFARQMQHSNQEVLGIEVNQYLNLSKTKRRQYRAIVHNCFVNGVEAEQREDEIDTADTIARIEGYLSYWEYINPKAARPSIDKFREAQESTL